MEVYPTRCFIKCKSPYPHMAPALATRRLPAASPAPRSKSAFKLLSPERPKPLLQPRSKEEIGQMVEDNKGFARGTLHRMMALQLQMAQDNGIHQQTLYNPADS